MACIKDRVFVISRRGMSALSILAFAFSLSSASLALAQGDPGPNTNLIGLTPDPADIRDKKARQQNEPSCAVRPGNSACIICGYNDYRTIDVFGDGWQGVSMSCDAGYNWVSRIAPGSPADSNLDARINGAFAADPRMVAIPGMAMLNFIAGYRDNNDGVVAVQHWLEVNKEDFDHYEPGKFTYIVDSGTSGKFLDKPDALPVLDPPSQQGTITLITEMENPDLGDQGVIERSFPTGTLYVAYAAFTGNQGSGTQSVKVLVNTSKDWGQTWTNQVLKLSEDQNVVSGISLTAIGGTVLATWRRQNDNNDFDSIMYSFITQDGKKATKGKVLADICTFDQSSTASPLQVTFRTNDFPWTANDGKNFYIFYSDRAFGSDNGSCATGHPRIVMNYASASNKAWQANPLPIDAAPTDEFGTPNPESLQFMPSAFGANGKVQIAWYDTRREVGLPPDLADTLFPDLPASVGDYVSTTNALVQRKVDVYTTRITSDSNGAIQPIPTPVRVSQYRIAAEVENTLPDGQGGQLDGTLKIEGEASFANKKLYASGSLSFLGDYITVAGQQFRQIAGGKWANNSSPVVSPALDKADFFVAWTSNRDVRGNIVNIEDTLPFSPTEEDLPQTTENKTTPDDLEENPIMLADAEGPSPDTGPPADRKNTAEGLDGADATLLECSPLAEPLDRSRDSNIYGSVVKDRVRLYAPTAVKPLSGLQRALVVVLANTESVEKTFRLEIAGPPSPCVDASLCRASFRQQPSLPPFTSAPPPTTTETLTVPPSSSFMRTVFVVADNEDAQVTVQAFDDDCSANPDCAIPLASIVLGGTADMRNPEFDSLACAELTTAECNVLRDEFHNPALINPTLINPNLINPTLINPTLINPNLINPNLINYYLANPTLINPFLINPALINYTLANPTLINPTLINPNLINPNLINDTLENPNLINPNLINPNLINTAPTGDPIATIDDLTYTDYNFVVQNAGNVTTAYNADVTIDNPTNAPIDTQLIAWAPSFTTTTVDCAQRLQVEANVFSTVNNPDTNFEIANIDFPFRGEISGLARAGEGLIFTLRVFGDRDDLETLTVAGFTTASQAANCTRDIPPDAPPGYTGEWFCYASLSSERELIILDTLAPTLNLPLDSMQEAAGPDGAIVTYTVTATDAGDPNPTFGCSPASGTLFPLGSTVVDCSATDAVGNTSFGAFTVTVVDMTAPTITAPGPVTVEATAASTPIADVPLGTPVTLDLVGIALVENDAPTTFGVGETTVTWTVTDTSGNTASADQLVTIVDTTPPTIAAPLDIGQEAEFVLNSVALGSATATDIVGVTDISNNADILYPGGFPVGDNLPVTWTARDAAGNEASDIQLVTITDTTPPVFNVVPGQEFNFEATLPPDPPGAYVDLGSAVTATDKGVLIPVTCTVDGTAPVVVLPATLPAGNYDITCTASDGSTLAISVMINVNVQDLVAPVLTVPSMDVTADADPLTGTAEVNFVVSATDIIDPSPEVSCTPPSGSTFPVGTTTVTCTATDDGPNATGQPNVTTATFDVVIADATPPVFTVVDDPYVVSVPDPGTAVVPLAVDFSSNVSASDVVDGSIAVVCTPSSGSLFNWGNTPVTCTATDDSDNISSATFDVLVEFPYDIDLIVPKGRAEAGSTVKIDWTYSLQGTTQVIDSSAFGVAVTWLRYSGNNCSGTPGTMEGADSGNSDFRYSNPDDSWRFNWQTPNMPGSYVVTVLPPGTNDGSNTDSSECVTLK